MRGTRRGMPWLFGVAMPRYSGLGTMRRGAARRGSARRGTARSATPWCCRLTYLSAAAPPATGSAASVQSGVLPICILDSPPGQSNDSPVYPFLALSRSSSLPASPSLSHLSFTSSPLPPLLPRFLSLCPLSLRAMPLKRPRVVLSRRRAAGTK